MTQLDLAPFKDLDLTVRRPSCTLAEHRHFLNPKLYMAVISTAWSAAVFKPLSSCSGRRSYRPDHTVRGRDAIRRNASSKSGSLPSHSSSRMMLLRSYAVADGQVESVKSITPQNSTYIPEYLLPQMRHLATDSDVFVRTTYARCLVQLADAAITMLELSQATKTNKSELEASGIVEPDYDSMLNEIQAVVEEQATTLLVDSSSQVKRAFLSSVADLCLFFGRQKSNETVLSHIMTYLNDRDWLLRLAFFDGIVDVGAFIGIKAVEEYVLPLMLQALAGEYLPEPRLTLANG